MSINSKKSALKGLCKLELIQGGKISSCDQPIFFSSDLYFSNTIFTSLLEEIKQISLELSTSKNEADLNLTRRADRLIAIGLQHFQEGLFIETNSFARTLRTDVYRYLSELIILVMDLGLAEEAALIDELLYNEIASEVVTTLMSRAGRQQSAAVLAVQYGLIAKADVAAILESVGLDSVSFGRALTAAFHDITEIQANLQYQGDLTQLPSRDPEELATCLDSPNLEC